jgi:muramidase (phage lysozyme)
MDIDLKLNAFLSLVAFSEGTSTSPITRNNGYDVIVSGVDGPSIFTDYSDHPFAHGGSVLVRSGPPPLYSTAAGRYQLLARFWNIYRVQLNLPDYSPASQDAVALQQIKERGAIADIEAGEIELAIGLCANIWASLPGNSYNQGGKTMATLVTEYESLLAA